MHIIHVIVTEFYGTAHPASREFYTAYLQIQLTFYNFKLLSEQTALIPHTSEMHTTRIPEKHLDRKNKKSPRTSLPSSVIPTACKANACVL